MANEFTNRKKLEYLATAVKSNLVYSKASKEYFPQSELANRKYGQTVHVFLSDPGRVYDTLAITDDDIAPVVEREVSATMEMKGTAVEVDLWDKFVNIEDFAKTVVKPRAQKLAREIDKAIVNKTVFKSFQSVVKTGTVGADLLSEAATKLDELSLAGTKVEFQKPTIYGEISNDIKGHWFYEDKMKDLWKSLYFGEFATASQIACPVLPVIEMSANMDTAPTVTLTAITDSNSNVIGYEPFSKLTSSGGSATFEPGAIYKISGLKIVDPSGIETEQDLEVKVLDAQGHIPEVRITVGGKGCNNPNAWVSAAFGSTTQTFSAGLTAGKKYQIGICRIDDSLCYDAYKFADLPSGKMDSVGVDGSTVMKMMSFGNAKQGTELTRIDSPYVADIFEPRLACTTYLQLN